MSKLTIHCQGIPFFANRFVSDSGVEYIKLIDPPLENPFPGVKIIGRTYMPDDEANAMVARGAAGGEEWFNHWYAFYTSRPYVHAWEFVNEPQPMIDPDFRASLNEATIAWSGLMDDHGWKTVGGCYGVGWPDVGTAKELGAGLEMCTYWAVHEYSAPTMDTEFGWLCGRFPRTVAELRAAGYKIKPLLITECGIDGGVYTTDNPKAGWKTYASEDEYLEQLKWYDSLLMKYDYVEAATIFVAGPNQEWIDFEVTESLAAKLSDYIQATPNPPVEEIDRARGIDVSRWQGEIDFDRVKADGYSFVIIRASGPNDDKTDVVKDPYFDQNYERAKAAGLLVGAYHGLQDGFGGQALLLVNSVGDRELDLGYFADLEVKTLSDEKCAAHVNAVDARLVERFGWPEGKYCKIYTSPGFMQGRDTSFAVDRELWLAHWTESEEDIIIPAPWTSWKFWQHGVGDAGYVDGISTRIDLDVYNGTVDDLYDEFGPIDDNNGGEEGMVEVFDLNGNVIENGWADAVARGARLISAEPTPGAAVWRVKKLILDTSGSMAFRMYANDENGAPIKGVVIFEGWKDGDLLPDDAAPRISEELWGQPEGLPNRIYKLNDQFTNVDGYLEWSWGSGEFLNPNEVVHWGWVMPGDNHDFSDVFIIPGWWDEHIKYWVVFEKNVADGDDGGDGNGDDVVGEVDLTEVVAQLSRIAESVEYMKNHWPQIP